MLEPGSVPLPGSFPYSLQPIAGIVTMPMNAGIPFLQPSATLCASISGRGCGHRGLVCIRLADNNLALRHDGTSQKNIVPHGDIGHRNNDNQTRPVLVRASSWFAGYVP
jgi:hypothetical protein